MFGSNFPIEKIWTSYEELVDAHADAAAKLPAADARNLLHDTAMRIIPHRLNCTDKTAGETMALEIKVLDYGDIELELSFLVLGRDCGRTRRVPTFGFLMGGTWPVVVDTGYRSNQIMETLGMRGLQFHENMIENQLAKHGVRMGDIRYVLHTRPAHRPCRQGRPVPDEHHGGCEPARVEYSVSGLMHPQYPLPDIKHLIDRLHTKSALRFFDLEISGPVQPTPGVRLEAAGVNTEGSMNVHVDTAGRSSPAICGDVIYDFNDQIVTPFHEISDMVAGRPAITASPNATRRRRSRSCSPTRNTCCRCTHLRRRSNTAWWWGACTMWCRGRWCRRCRSETGFRRELRERRRLPLRPLLLGERALRRSFNKRSRERGTPLPSFIVELPSSPLPQGERAQ